MGVDTKGFVLTPVKDALLITALAAGALDSLIREEADIEFPGVRPWDDTRKKRFRSVDAHMRPDSNMVQLQFTFKGDARQLSMFFRCDSDQSEHGPRSISFSLGLHGESELFVTNVAYALSMLGPAWVDRSDCDDVGPLLLAETPLTIAGAVALGYADALCLENWFDTATALGLDSSATEALMGLPFEQLKGLGSLSYDELKALVSSVPVPCPGFLDEYHQRIFTSSARAPEA
jgi:hypothetical protein